MTLVPPGGVQKDASPRLFPHLADDRGVGAQGMLAQGRQNVLSHIAVDHGELRLVSSMQGIDAQNLAGGLFSLSKATTTTW